MYLYLKIDFERMHFLTRYLVIIKKKTERCTMTIILCVTNMVLKINSVTSFNLSCFYFFSI